MTPFKKVFSLVERERGNLIYISRASAKFKQATQNYGSVLRAMKIFIMFMKTLNVNVSSFLRRKL